MKTLIDNLKTNGEDYEFYPTSKEMVKTIYKYLTTNSEVDILDIGCGNGNFKKKFEEEAKNNIKSKLVCEQKDKAKNLVMLYEDELNTLFNNFKAICSMDIEDFKKPLSETNYDFDERLYGRLSTENLTKNFELKMELMNSIEILTIAINDLY